MQLWDVFGGLPNRLTGALNRHPLSKLRLTFDLTTLVTFSLSVPSTAVSLAAMVLVSWPVTGSRLLAMARQDKHKNAHELKSQRRSAAAKRLIGMVSKAEDRKPDNIQDIQDALNIKALRHKKACINDTPGSQKGRINLCNIFEISFFPPQFT